MMMLKRRIIALFLLLILSPRIGQSTITEKGNDPIQMQQMCSEEAKTCNSNEIPDDNPEENYNPNSNKNNRNTRDIYENTRYQISTLNSNPHRCLHISKDSGNTPESICFDVEDWTDGTNGCPAYFSNEGWCQLYGHIRKPEDEPGVVGLNAKEACCVCKGGETKQQEYGIGDLVKLPQVNEFESCLLKVNKIPKHTGLPFTFEVMEDCGDDIHRNFYGRRFVSKKYSAGFKVRLVLQDGMIVERAHFTELRKCRPGSKDQEFWVIPRKNHDNHDPSTVHINEFIIQHVATNTTLSFDANGDKEDAVILQDAFSNEDIQFEGSHYFVHISSITDDPISHALVNGAFAETDYSQPKWKVVNADLLDLSYSMWTLKEVIVNSDDIDENQKFENDAHLEEHIKWITDKMNRGNLDYLQQLAPWHLLDVERDSPRNEVKAHFRRLSRQFHPDKKGGPLFEQVFVLLQQAYDGLKKSNEYEKERFRVEAEVEAQLFPHSMHVVELLPSDWKLIGNGTRTKYVISTTKDNNTPVEEHDTKDAEVDPDNDSKNISENAADSTTSEQLWLLFLYSPRCSMSRSVVSFVELAAAHLSIEENIRVGAFGCGLYGESLQESKTKGHVASFDDPICKQFQRRETPNTHVVVEALDGRQDHLEQTSKFTRFYAAAATGGTKDLWPRKLIDFAISAKRGWEDRNLVQYHSKYDLEDPTFHSVPRIIAFVNDIDDTEIHEVQEAVLSMMPTLARQLKATNFSIGIISCAAEDEDDQTLVDCSTLEVGWLPDVKIFGANQTNGISVISDQFLERRDAQIAIEAMANTIFALLGITENGFDQLDHEEEVIDNDKNVGGDCGMQDFQFEHPDDGRLKKVEGKENLMLLQSSDGKASPNPKLKEKMLDSSGTAKPKLADRRRQRTNQLPRYDARRSSAYRGAGVAIGGISQSTGGAIAG